MDALATIRREIDQVLNQVKEEAIFQFATTLQENTQALFVIGEGRSGFMAKAFAMRLMHLGAKVFVVGETITPALQEKDLLLAISGSGTTTSVVDKAQKAKKMGCKVLSLTTDPESPLAQTSDQVLVIPAATKYRKPGEMATVQPLSSLFDQSVHLILDTVCLTWATARSESNAVGVKRHANLE